MRQGGVVQARQEARRRRRVRVGQEPGGHVEQLAPARVAERAQLGPQALEHLAQPGHPRPRAHVGHGGGAEGGQVAADELGGRRLGLQRPVQPPLQRRQPHLARLLEQPARGHLDTGREVRDAHRQRVAIGVGPAVGQQLGELALGAWLGGHQLDRRRGHLRRVRPGHALAEVAGERLPVQPPGQRVHGQRVGRGGQVDRAAHDPQPHRRAGGQRLFELRRVEAGDARPQAQVRVQRLLGLHARQPLEHLGHVDPLPLQQALAGQQRPVQRAVVQHPLSHRERAGSATGSPRRPARAARGPTARPSSRSAGRPPAADPAAAGC